MEKENKKDDLWKNKDGNLPKGKPYRQVILFLIVTTCYIVSMTCYFEYAVNREMEEWLSITLTLAAGALTIGYFYYVVKQIIKTLKIK